MCGIVGFWQEAFGSREASAVIIDAMSSQLEHRGPDSHGSWVDIDSGIAFGHRRLSIVDLTAAGHQPMQSSCGRWVLTFNGEIYNHMEIRGLLLKAGHAITWRGHSDTETLLAAISLWGVEEAIKSTVGMFAFALWDRKERVIVLARDRVGEKPLYYGWQGVTFMFASELKALRRHPDFRGDIDSHAVRSFLSNNYIPAPQCIYKGLYKLPPASVIRISERDLRSRSLPKPVRYWSVVELAQDSGPYQQKSLERNIDELDDLLRSVLKNQMLADVPLGAFLSGGIDSSLIVALMQSMSARPIKTFSIGMPDARLDESTYASAVAKHLGTDHHPYTITPEIALDIIPRLTEIWDEPFADSSQIPTVLVSRFARSHVTVALSGDGADELFLGYKHYRSLRRLWRYRVPVRVPFRIIDGLFGGRGSAGMTGLSPRMIKALNTLLYCQSKDEFIDKYYDRYRSESNPAIIVPEHEIARDQSAAAGYPPLDDLALRGALHDQLVYLPDDIMVKVDRASMSASLETRAPFLDHRVVEYAWRTPVQHKLKGRETKRVLRHLLYRYVPKKLLERPKQGFSIPIAKWLRKELYEWADSLLVEQDLERCGLNSAQVLKYWREHNDGEDHGSRMWAILMLRAFIESERADV